MWVFSFLKSTTKLSLFDLHIYCPDAVLAQGTMCRDLNSLSEKSLLDLLVREYSIMAVCQRRLHSPYIVFVLSLMLSLITRAY